MNCKWVLVGSRQRSERSRQVSCFLSVKSHDEVSCKIENCDTAPSSAHRH